METSEMSGKHFGPAVVIAGLLTASPVAMGEVEQGSPARTEISGYGGWGHFAAPIQALIVDSGEVADVNPADSLDTRSLPFENNPMSEFGINIPPTTRSSVISNSPAGDPLSLLSTFDKGDSGDIEPAPSAAAHRSISAPRALSRSLTLVSQAKVDLASCWLRAVRWAGCESIRRRNEITRRLVLKELLPEGRLGPTAESGLGERAAAEPPDPDGLNDPAKLVQPFALSGASAERLAPFSVAAGATDRRGREPLG
jgi:hypothetical protein